MMPEHAPFTLHHGDCAKVLRELDDCSVDAIVTDPPYGLTDYPLPAVEDCLRKWLAGKPYRPKRGTRGFMGKQWDGWIPGPEVWKQCLRVLKPGGHLLAFSSTRTQDLFAQVGA